MALWDKNLPFVWLSQIPSCNSLRSSFDASGWMQSRYGPEKEHLYNFWSLDSQKWGVFLRILLASNLSAGKMSPIRNSTMGSIQLDLTLRGVHKTHQPTKSNLTRRVGSVFRAWWVGLGYKIFFYSGLDWVWVIKLQTRQTRPDPPIFNIYLKYIIYLIIFFKNQLYLNIYYILNNLF